MHIADGVLPVPTIVGSFVLAGAWIGATARKLSPDDMPRIAVMSAAFFVGSAISLPLGATSVHLLLHGLVGIVLGVHALLAIAVGLVFQKLLFMHGGITTLGINACIMGFPAVALGLVYAKWVRSMPINTQTVLAGLLTAVTVAASTLIAAVALVTGGEDFRTIAGVFLVAHVPVMIVEGLIAAVVIRFLSQVKPELLGGSPPALEKPLEEQADAS